MALTTPSGLKRSNVARSSFVAKRQHAEALLQRGRRRGLVVDDPGPRSLALERGVRGVLGHLAAGTQPSVSQTEPALLGDAGYRSPADVCRSDPRGSTLRSSHFSSGKGSGPLWRGVKSSGPQNKQQTDNR
jgi:hypothetical protein